MKLAIIGSRSFSDYDLLRLTIQNWFDDDQFGLWFDEVISGGAKGADQLAARWVGEHNKLWPYTSKPIKLTEFIPDWDTHGKRAGPLRNEDIIKACDMVLCFWDGESRGTRSSLSIAKRLKKPTMIIYF